MSKNRNDRQTENELAEFVIDCKLCKRGWRPLFNADVKLDSECIRVLESIPEWTWDLRPYEVVAMADKAIAKGLEFLQGLKQG